MQHSHTGFGRHIFAVLFFVIMAASNAFADDAPSWLRQAASHPVPSYEKNVSAVVLLDEQQTTLTDGKLKVVENYALKVINREGRGKAFARAYYLVSSGKINDLKAWLIRPDGTVKSYDKKTIIDMIADPDDVYNEGRVKLIDATDDADSGYVFGYS